MVKDGRGEVDSSDEMTDEGLRYESIEDMITARSRHGYRSDRAYVEELVHGQVPTCRRWNALLTKAEAFELDLEASDFDGDGDMALAYAESHPDAWAGSFLERSPLLRLVLCFADDHLPHEEALRPTLRHQQRVRFRTVRYTEVQLEAAMKGVDDVMASIEIVRPPATYTGSGRHRRPIASWGTDAVENAVVLELPPGNDLLATRLQDDFGDLIRIVIRDRFGQ